MFRNYIFIYLFLSVILYFLALLIFKKTIKTAVYTTFLLLFFFGFGALHDLLKSTRLPSFLVSYRFILPATLVLFFGIGWFVKKKKKGFIQLNYYFNALFSLLLLVEGFHLVFNYLSNNQRNNDLADLRKKITNEYLPCPNCTKPDIYFIVWDGYTSSECLRNTFNYDNKELDSLLLQYHFYTSKHSMSNYRITPLSLASTFNLCYLADKGYLGRTISPKMMLQAVYTIQKNELIPVLEKEGYAIKNYSIFDFDKYPTQAKLFFPFYQEQLLYNETFAGRIEKDIGWNLSKFFQGKKEKGTAVFNRQRNELINYFINLNIEKLLKTVHEKKEKPVFVYTHIMLPHEPFFFDEKGNFVPDSVFLNQKKLKQPYLKQLIYTNSILKKILAELVKDSTRQKIIVMEGDHGFRNYENDSENEKAFMNLNTYYFPDHNYSQLYDNISPVNTFRVILNKYFKQRLPLLADSSIYIDEGNGN